MNKIRFEIDPNINYLYHMLSVARCGYDNDYGKSTASCIRRRSWLPFMTTASC